MDNHTGHTSMINLTGHAYLTGAGIYRRYSYFTVIDRHRNHTSFTLHFLEDHTFFIQFKKALRPHLIGKDPYRGHNPFHWNIPKHSSLDSYNNAYFITHYRYRGHASVIQMTR